MVEERKTSGLGRLLFPALALILLLSFSFTVSAQAKTTQILFVGNSKTYRNDIPGKVAKLAKSAGKSVRVTEAVASEKNLSWLSKHQKDILTARAYDYVVIQESSYTYKNYQDFLKGAQAIRKLVRKKNPKVKIIVRKVWLYKNSSASQKKQVYRNAEKVAKKIKATLANDGPAFDKCMKKYPSLKLFTDDRHPSKQGAYLSACSIYSAIFKKSPVGLSYRAGLKKSTAQKLQRIAASVR